jgi:ISXO2-like transposase domain
VGLFHCRTEFSCCPFPLSRGPLAFNLHRPCAAPSPTAESCSTPSLPQPRTGRAFNTQEAGALSFSRSLKPQGAGRPKPRLLLLRSGAPGTVYTDDAVGYEHLHTRFVHDVVNHAETYVRGRVHTNGMENFWSLLKRTLRGTYVAVEPFHLDGSVLLGCCLSKVMLGLGGSGSDLLDLLGCRLWP